MSLDNVRVNELAKELNLTSKDVLDKFAQLSIPVKSHSSTVTADQIQRLKNFIAAGSKIEVKKPKAFVVKKLKTESDTEKPAIITEVELEKPQIEVVKPVPNRLEIVRRAPQKNPNEVKPKFQHPQARPTGFQQDFRRHGENKFPPRPTTTGTGERPKEFPQRPRPAEGEFRRPLEGQKPQGGAPVVGERGDKKQPIQRHIISQDIYDNKGGIKRKIEKKKDKVFTTKEEEQERISLEKAAAQKHKKRNSRDEEIEQVTKLVVNRALTISELSIKIQKTPAEIVKFLMMQGVMATVNQLIDIDTIKKVCVEFELEVLDEDVEAFMEQELAKEAKNKALLSVDKKLLKHRAPVVSIMGHVDHGKTTLLDSIRASKHKIVSTEVGGITQSIGAYTVHVDKKKIVFIDTPGHEAFTEMRARGAKATDIAILVVAADDGIMPQTIEAINHAKAADTPIIVAVNKIDKEGANPDKVLQQLTEHGLVAEEWGGDTIVVKVSALQGTGIDELLEYILLLSEMADLKANPKAQASGVVIEANLDKGKGPVATFLVQNGTLRIGNCVVVGSVGGRVRALLSDEGERVLKAEPSTPVEILGLAEVPSAGDHFEVVGNEKEMKAIVDKRKENERSRRLDSMLPAHIRKESSAGDEALTQLKLIIKANTNGSAEAVSQAVAQLESKEIASKIIHVGVGDISEADVMLASASGAIILGFGVKEDTNALGTAEREGVVIKKYDIIYQILEDLEKQMLSLLQPEIKHVELGAAEVRQIFTVGKTTRIAGCTVTEGKIQRGKTAIVLRDGKEIFKGVIDQLKRFKDDVKEVSQGFECGISFAKFNDLQEGDIIEVSTTEEVERVTLD
ncbi:MAG: translation initiation factor IF-2 [bacterium]